MIASKERYIDVYLQGELFLNGMAPTGIDAEKWSVGLDRYPCELEELFGIIPGTNDCLFTKTGRGGTIHGYNGKYITLAGEIYSKYGYTVCVSANPSESSCDLKREVEYLLSVCPNIERIFFAGISNGALVGAQQAWEISMIEKMLLINGPLMINWHKTKSGIEKAMDKNVMFVYGDKDPSYRYAELIKLIESPLCQLYIVPGADHQFKGMEKEFAEIVDYFVAEGEFR